MELETHKHPPWSQIREKGLLRFMLRFGGRFALTLLVAVLALSEVINLAYDAPWRLALSILICASCGVIMSLCAWIALWWFNERRDKKTANT